MAVMLSTIDNPFNPFIDWDEWKKYDEQHGYFSCAYLDRIASPSNELSDEDYQLAIESAIDSILEHDPTCMFIKVTETDGENPSDRGEGV